MEDNTKNNASSVFADANALNNLGERYYYGRGVEQDYKKAVECYRKAAELGLAEAQCNLGYCYKTGYGVERDLNMAVRWFRKAAEQGDEDAKAALKKFGY